MECKICKTNKNHQVGEIYKYLVRRRLNSFTKQHLSKVLRRPLLLNIFAKVKPLTDSQIVTHYERQHIQTLNNWLQA